MLDNRTVGKTIATLRQARGMTQQQLAAALNVSHQAVSKWENGATLPDIQTLMDLTRLFGISVEQLLNGEIPAARLDNAKTLDDHLQNIGSFVNGVIDDIGNLFRSEPKTEDVPAAEDGAEDASIVNEAEAPKAEENGDIDLQELLQMAPYMSKGAVEEMLRRVNRRLTAAEIAPFAPFIETEFLEELITKCESDISWNTLRRVAPYLKKEAVDAFAKAIAVGERAARPALKDVNKAVDDLSKKLGTGVDTAVRKVVKIGENVASTVTKAFDDWTSETASHEQRMANLRRSAFERAIQDGRWKWIEAHIGEITDEALKRRISAVANEQGMQDWVSKNLGGYADDATIDAAIEDGDWGWLGEHVWKFGVEAQQRVALAAMRCENWQWLSAYAEQIDLTDCAVEIAAAARHAGARLLAVQLMRYDMQSEQIEACANEVLKEEDYDFFEMMLDLLPQDVLCKCCIHLAKTDKWETVRRFMSKLSPKSIEWLMQIAIDSGNFDAIDMLDDALSGAKGAEEE